jgi:hypothetical protein
MQPVSEGASWTGSAFGAEGRPTAPTARTPRMRIATRRAPVTRKSHLGPYRKLGAKDGGSHIHARGVRSFDRNTVVECRRHGAAPLRGPERTRPQRIQQTNDYGRMSGLQSTVCCPLAHT